MQKYLQGPLYRAYLKRLIDIFLSITLLILFSPICAVTAVIIKLTSPGPLFADVPERIGRNTKRFTMYKFRSMINNAHVILRTDPKFAELFSEYKKGSYKLLNDPRVTKFGTIIRKHSIDEIPQLLNVLKGQMSIVGPRAYYKDELEDQQKKYPHTRALVKRVLSLNPGITGLWQVSGRSEINFDKRIALDASYVDNLSLWNDLKIILKTPWIMITGRGAV
ncbi:MAG: sugar transferase [Microgenomates group bacterium]|nr:sugar transferase [Candidatus Woesebacteria bacterium]MBP6883478.1 sugar transferase [Candidatus Woesebacteria bacterium]QQR63488.1 MAG: sugar transferase [Candidatus Roizmanbacteria bacterium]